MTHISPTLRTWILAALAILATTYALYLHFNPKKTQNINPNIIQIQLQK